MTPSLSMRAAWQQVADRHKNFDPRDERAVCTWCSLSWPCPDRVTALAQINALNEAKHLDIGEGLTSLALCSSEKVSSVAK